MCVESQRGLLYPLSLGDEVNFRLTYDGPLKAASQSENRRIDKHKIRCVFDRQLHELMEVRHHVLDEEFGANMEWITPDVNPCVTRGEFLCLALVREKLNLVCDLDILFLRREDPGRLISGGGDIDNRLKVLFDALRIPQDDNEVRGIPIHRKSLLLCLTEDDRLITGFRITTDRLLEPADSEAEQNNVRLIINVEVKATKLTKENMAYFSHF